MDKEAYITNIKDFKFKSAESLYGKKIATVRGYNYFELDNYFKKNIMTRVDVSTEIAIPKMVTQNRANLGIIGQSTLSYFFT